MKTYQVTMIEKWARTVEVDAIDEGDARDKAREAAEASEGSLAFHSDPASGESEVWETTPFGYTPCHGACHGTGILYKSHTGSPGHWDVDYIARCDACASDIANAAGPTYAGDYEAAKALAAEQNGGAWLVYVNDLDAGPPLTEDPLLFVRHSTDAVASLQRDLLAAYPDFFVMTEFVMQA